MGFDAYYLKNDNDAARDLLFGEDPTKKFETAFPLEMYLSNSMEYGGDKDFFTKFGLEIRNTINVIVSKRSFSQRVPQNTFSRPREGDLIYIPILNGHGELYEIKFTGQNKDMSMLGRKTPYFYDLELEKFKYSNEVINTGIPDIDIVVTESSYTINLIMGSGSNNYTTQEIVFQSYDNTFANSFTSATVQSWNAPSGVLSVTNIRGEFLYNVSIIGVSSNASYVLSNYDPLNEKVKDENYDNEFIISSATNILDTSESNPMGGI
jgi:hypothetical protein